MTVFYVHNNADWVQLAKQVAHTPLTSEDVVRINADFTLTTLVALTIGSAWLNGDGHTITFTNDGTLNGLISMTNGTISNLKVNQDGGTLTNSVLLQNGSSGTLTVCQVFATAVNATGANCGIIVNGCSGSLSISRVKTRLSVNASSGGTVAGFAYLVALNINLSIDKSTSVMIGSGTENFSAFVYHNDFGTVSVTQCTTCMQNAAYADALHDMYPYVTFTECMIVIAGTTPASRAIGLLRPTEDLALIVRDIYLCSFNMTFPFSMFAEIGDYDDPIYSSALIAFIDQFVLQRCCIVSSVLPTCFVQANVVSAPSWRGRVNLQYSVVCDACVAPTGTTQIVVAPTGTTQIDYLDAVVYGTLIDVYAATSAGLSTTYWQDYDNNPASYFSPYFVPMLKCFLYNFGNNFSEDETLRVFGTSYWTAVFKSSSGNLIENLMKNPNDVDNPVGETLFPQPNATIFSAADSGLRASTPTTGDTWYDLGLIASAETTITLTTTTDWSTLASTLNGGVGLAANQTVQLGGNITFYDSAPATLTLGAAIFDGKGYTISLVYAGASHMPLFKVTSGFVSNLIVANSFLGSTAAAVLATDDSYGTFAYLRLSGNCLGGGVVRCGVVDRTTLIKQTDFSGFATEPYAGGLFGTSASTVLPSAGGVYTESGASGINFTCENCTVTMQFFGTAGSMQGAIACVLAGPADLSSSITSIIRTCRSQVTHVHAAGDTGALVSYMTGGTLERCYATALMPQLFFVAKLKPGVSNAITLQNCYYINPVTENPNNETVGAMFVKTVDATSKNVAIVQCYFVCGELPLSELAATSRFLYSVTVDTLTLTRCFISADDNTAASTACYETLVSGSVPTPTAALANIQGEGGAAVLTS